MVLVSRWIPAVLFVLGGNLFWESTSFDFLWKFSFKGNNAEFKGIIQWMKWGGLRFFSFEEKWSSNRTNERSRSSDLIIDLFFSAYLWFSGFELVFWEWIRDLLSLILSANKVYGGLSDEEKAVKWVWMNSGLFHGQYMPWIFYREASSGLQRAPSREPVNFHFEAQHPFWPLGLRKLHHQLEFPAARFPGVLERKPQKQQFTCL